ncbi:MAG: hypothetical protein LLF92_00565 [Planctomycetaceae bacterium]|nr:hypothetical protein [Planctomycetaceae bacterium]
MDETKKDSYGRPIPPPIPNPNQTNSVLSGNIIDTMAWKNFLNVAGASVFYCLSAVFVAYGIVKVMGPILSASNSLREALPCLFTLHFYEIALLGVLILIVYKKAVDDAVSLVILIAMFLVGTSIALGSVADTAIKAGFYAGIIGVVLAFIKFFCIKRLVKIQIGIMTFAGLLIIMIFNYLGPVFMANIISEHASQRELCRGYWLNLNVLILIGAVFVIIEAARKKMEEDKKAFLQKPTMAYIFALILLAMTGIHQYAIGYSFAIKYVFGDFIPVIAISSILLFEIFHHNGKRFDILSIVSLCVPLLVTMLAINNKSILASGHINASLFSYPPVILALSGIAIAALAKYHRWKGLIILTVIYGLGVVLTAGFSPEHPYDLNIRAFFATCSIISFAYGIFVWNQYFCIAGIISLCFLLPQFKCFAELVKENGLTKEGTLVGMFGFGSMILYILFGQSLNKAIRIIGTIFFAIFLFDYLPESFQWRFPGTLIATGLIIFGVWIRTKDSLIIPILLMPFLFRLYMYAKGIGYWRQVIVGFLMLGVGTVISLFKNSIKNIIKKGNEN